ncbi:Phosphatidylserine decarboxylase proenzyme, mitochondrial [Amphibalanus amphitrite]|uniref:Phosphatidylserine decarboxylase proenzyme, mitochondrial n=1 Tax=Amphibalanus amphitrite TaxID=1232801 RepID=A0A6A4XA49_AMPAM|nr:Phosphatidylserine decarboxylase proenzyme, mitochondrial [Amphibalanus amphitrite]
MCRAPVHTGWYAHLQERRSLRRRQWREKLRSSQRRVAGAVHHGSRALITRLLAVLGLLVSVRMAFLDGSLVVRWSRGGPGRVLLDTRTLWQARPGEGSGSGSGGGQREQRWSARWANYVRSLRWTPIPLGVGFALIAYQQYRHVLVRERKRTAEGQIDGPVIARPWEVSAYRLLPLRTISRAWGWINSHQLPLWARQPVLGWYVRTFGCKMEEAAEPDLLAYDSLSALFRRELKPGARPVDPHCPLVSPCDGTVLHLGPVDSGRLEQVKGVTYTLNKFLGPSDWETGPQVSAPGDHDEHAAYHQRLVTLPGNSLFHCVIYLAPGDYHRFHSPADWTVRHRRHFPGDLLSVSPLVANWIAGVFCLNERAIYTGKWRHGFFSFAAVGATNVGSIRVYCDETLLTNCRRWRPGVRQDLRLDVEAPHSCVKGAPFGEFNLGSTIVLVFEAPSDFQFSVQPGDPVRMGRPLGASAADAVTTDSPAADAATTDAS